MARSIKIGDVVTVVRGGDNGYIHNLALGGRWAVVSIDADGYVGLRIGAATGFAPLFCLANVRA